MDKAALDARLRIITLLWGALAGGVTLFAAVVVGLTTGTVGRWTPTLSPSLAGTLLAVPVLSMIAGILLRRGGGAKRSDDPEARVAAYQTQVIVGAALQEGGGLFGLALSLLAGQPSWAVGVWAITMVAMGLTRPTRDELDQRLR